MTRDQKHPYGPQALELLKKGLAPDAIVKDIWDSDPDPQPIKELRRLVEMAVKQLPRGVRR